MCHRVIHILLLLFDFDWVHYKFIQYHSYSFKEIELISVNMFEYDFFVYWMAVVGYLKPHVKLDIDDIVLVTVLEVFSCWIHTQDADCMLISSSYK